MANKDIQGHIKLNKVVSQVSDNAAKLGDNKFNSKKSLSKIQPKSVKPKGTSYRMPIQEKKLQKYGSIQATSTTPEPQGLPKTKKAANGESLKKILSPREHDVMKHIQKKKSYFDASKVEKITRESRSSIHNFLDKNIITNDLRSSTTLVVDLGQNSS